MSYCAVGRKYGVSDNAIRKWLRWYEYERDADERSSSDDPPDTIAA
jgi:transposase-like protein